MKKILVGCLALLALAACNKDEFKTVPQITIDSFGPDVVVKGQIITLSATVTDKEGDLQDTLTIVKKRFNGNNLLSTDTLPRRNLKTIGFPTKDKIQVEIQFSYGEIPDNYISLDQEAADRGLVIGLIIKDKANNKSEYVESNKILLKKL